MCAQKNSDVCKECKIKVKKNEEALQCDECDAWFHIACEKVNKGLYEAIKKYGEGLWWFCSKCEDNRKNNINLKAEVEEVNKRVNDIDKMIAKIREEVLGDVMVRVKKELIGEVERLKTELVEEVSRVSEKVDQISRDVKYKPSPNGTDQVTA